MKKILLLLFGAVILFGNTSTALFAQNEFRFGQDLGIISSHVSYDSTNQRRAKEDVVRREAPQIFMRLADHLKVNLPTSSSRCNFSDIGIRQVSDTVAQQIQEACKISIFKGTYGKFYPNAYFTNAEAITSVIRITDGIQRETNVVHWSEPYYKLAKQQGLLQNNKLSRKFIPINRGDLLALILSVSDIPPLLKSSCPEIEILKQSAQKLYTGTQLTDMLVKLDKQCADSMTGNSFNTGSSSKTITGSTATGSVSGVVKFYAPICDKYFSVLNCAIKSQVPINKQSAYKDGITKTMKSRSALSSGQQQTTCQSAREKNILPESSTYKSYGCSL